MNVLPLINRELRAALRRSTAYRIRTLAASGSMALTVWFVLVSSGWGSGAKLGHTLFVGLTGAAFLASGLAGLFLTADCLSEEKRGGTLGLLFLTDLHSADIILGKLAAKILAPLYGLLGAFPTLATCVLFGGVTGGEFWRLFLALGNTLFFSLALGLFTSSFCRHQRLAHISALLAVLILFAGLPALGLALSRGSSHSPLDLFSPTASYFLAFDPNYRGGAGWFWGSLIMTHLIGWMSVAAACAILPKTWLDDFMPAQGQARRARPAQRRRENKAPGKKRIALLTDQPVCWLASRQRPAEVLIWFLPALGLVSAAFSPDPLGNGKSLFGFAALAGAHAFLKLWLAAQTSYAFAKDRQSGALELLLGACITEREMGSGMLRAYRMQFGPPLAALLLMDLVLAAGLALRGQFYGALWIAACGSLSVFDCYCLCWVGLWRGLVSMTPFLAMLSTILTTLVLPWLWFAAGAVVFGRSTQGELALLWLFVALANNTVFIVKAREGFLDYFRAMALRPYGAKAPAVESRWSPICWEDQTVTR